MPIIYRLLLYLEILYLVKSLTVLQEEAKINRLHLELFSQSTSHSEKDKLASVSYDHDSNFTASYENYAQYKATMTKNTMPSASNFESANISPVRQEMVLLTSY